LEAFRIPNDEKKFLCRTISSGASLSLDDPLLLEAVRQLKPVVFLDTAIRFSKSGDENSAAANRQLVDDVTALRAAGAVAVILLHHAKKDSGGNRNMTIENMLRGTGDFAAMCDMAYGVRKDLNLYQGNGVTEIVLASIKQRDLVNPPLPMRLAASYRKEGMLGTVSHISESGDFVSVGAEAVQMRTESSLLLLVSTNPDMKMKGLIQATGMTEYAIERILEKNGWHTVRGGPGGSSPWHRDGDKPCPYAKATKPGKAKAENPATVKVEVETRVAADVEPEVNAEDYDVRF
jgi:hypothetical protein